MTQVRQAGFVCGCVCIIIYPLFNAFYVCEQGVFFGLSYVVFCRKFHVIEVVALEGCKKFLYSAHRDHYRHSSPNPVDVSDVQRGLVDRINDRRFTAGAGLASRYDI